MVGLGLFVCLHAMNSHLNIMMISNNKAPDIHVMFIVFALLAAVMAIRGSVDAVGSQQPQKAVAHLDMIG